MLSRRPFRQERDLLIEHLQKARVLLTNTYTDNTNYQITLHHMLHFIGCKVLEEWCILCGLSLQGLETIMCTGQWVWARGRIEITRMVIFAESNKKQNSFPFDCFYCIPLGQDNLYELLSLNSSSEYFISSTIFFALTSLC